jgi:tricorn protease
MKIYELALTTGLRSPFAPPDELHPDSGKPEESKTETPKPDATKADASKADTNKSDESRSDKFAPKKIAPPAVNIDFTDLPSRLSEVPVPPGNYSELQATDKRLCWLERGEEPEPKQALQCLDIANKGDAPETVIADVRSYEVSLDRKKMLVRKGDDFFIFDSDVKAASLSDPKALPKAKIDISRWSFVTNPRSEFRELFFDAWRLERDYFYDRNTHGLDWKGIRDRYLPLVDRVSDRNELNGHRANGRRTLHLAHLRSRRRRSSARRPDRSRFARRGSAS